ncbi:hypothetical protein KUF71_020200, partial [Frankliniella fusca]
AMCRGTATTGALTIYLRETPMAGLLVRMCMALPFLPAERIDGAFADIERYAIGARVEGLHATMQRAMQPFLRYYDASLLMLLVDIGAQHISVYRRTRCTNNDQESYHRTLVDTLGTPHGNPWVWMDKFRDHEQRHRVRYLQASN